MFGRKTLEIPSEANALPGRAHPIPTATTHFVNGHALKGPYPAGLETAVFAMGCFWGVERIFWQVPGVWTTAVGYVNGVTPNPTYQEVCTGGTGHTEALGMLLMLPPPEGAPPPPPPLAKAAPATSIDAVPPIRIVFNARCMGRFLVTFTSATR